MSTGHEGRVAFKVLDVDEDPVQQRFTEGAYDTIIAFSISHATSNLERALRHTRKLLRPGGFLFIGEANESLQIGSLPGFIFGTLPGWWLGRDDGRVLSPLASTQQWDKLLKSTGYSGIDITAPDEFQTFFGASLFVSQAVDDTVNFLRAPLATPCQLLPIDNLAIVGGQSARSSLLVKDLKALLREFAAKCTIFETLEDVSYDKIGPNPAVIVLTELDKPVFKDITATGFSALKKMFGATKDLLWITNGRRWEEPFYNMTVGFGRTARNETPELRLQFLDVEDLGGLDVRKIAEIFLRLRTRAGEGDNILWTLEPEVIIDAGQRELIPRLRHISNLNQRFNSLRRAITHEVDVKSSTCVLQLSPTGSFLQELRLGAVDDEKPVTEICTTHTIYSAIMTPLGHKFLALGKEPSSGSCYLALVPSPASILRVPSTCAVPYSTTHLSTELLLALVAAHLVATSVLDHLFAGQTLVVHNPTKFIAHAITVHASAKNVCVVFTTDHRGPQTPSSWVNLPLNASRSALRFILPANTACFVGFWDQVTPRPLIESTFMSSLPRNCRKETADTIYSFDGCDHVSSDPVLAQILEQATAYAELYENQEEHSMLAEALRLEDLTGGTLPSNPMTVIDWTSPTLHPVRITSIESGTLFLGNKTYWLAGLTGALGLSLCDWMIGHGARSLVLTSRSPQVDSEWVSTHARKGAKITIISW